MCYSEGYVKGCHILIQTSYSLSTRVCLLMNRAYHSPKLTRRVCEPNMIGGTEYEFETRGTVGRPNR